jgi:hypothetical protein
MRYDTVSIYDTLIFFPYFGILVGIRCMILAKILAIRLA